MSPSTKRALSLLVAAALIMASLFLYPTLIRPEYEVVTELRGELASNLSVLEEQKTALTRAQLLIAQYQGVAAAGESLSLTLPVKEEVSSLVAQINAIARLSGIGIQSVGISYLPIKPAKILVKGIGALQVNLKLFGPYSALKQFVQSLERNIRIMDIKSLQMSSEKNQDLFNFNVIVDTYYQTK